MSGATAPGGYDREADFTRAELDELLEICRTLYPDEDSSLALLRDSGLDLRLDLIRPIPEGQLWPAILKLMRRSPVDRPNEHLLRALLARTPDHPRLQQLALAYGLLDPPAPEAGSAPTVLTDRLQDRTRQTRPAQHVVIRLPPGQADALAIMAALGLGPQSKPVWATGSAASYRLPGPVDDLSQRLTGAQVSVTQVVPASLNGTVDALRVVTAGGRVQPVGSWPVQALVADLFDLLIPGGPRPGATAQRIDARGHSHPLELGWTLQQAGLQAGEQVVVESGGPAAGGGPAEDAFWDARQLPPRGEWVGRDAPLARLVELVEDGLRGDQEISRIELVGPAGVGKTALLRELVRRVRDRFPGGVLLRAGDDLSPASASGPYLLVSDGAPAGSLPGRLPAGPQPRIWIAAGRSGGWPPGAQTVRLDLAPLAPPAAEQLWRLLTGGDPRWSDQQPALVARGIPAEIEVAAAIGPAGQRDLSAPLGTLLLDADRALGGPAAAALRALSVTTGATVPDGLARMLLAELPGRDDADELLAELDRSGLAPRVRGGLLLRDPVREFARNRLEAQETAGRVEALRTIPRRYALLQRGVQAEPRISRDYWTTDDRLSYRGYVDAIAEFILHRQTEPPLTIGIKAPWGAGKTSLMHMLQDRLDPPEPVTEQHPVRRPLTLVDQGGGTLPARTRWFGRRREEQGLTTAEVLDAVEDDELAGDAQPLRARPARPSGAWRPTVWFNPWIYQNGEQVWAGLAHEIIDQVTGRLPRAQREEFWLRLNLRRVDRGAVRRQLYRSVVETMFPLLVLWLVGLALAAALLLAGQVIDAVRPALRAISEGLAGFGTIAALAVAGWRVVTGLRSAAPGAVSSLTRPPDLLGAGRGAAGGVAGRFEQLMPDPGYQGRLGFLHLVHLDIRRVLDLVATRDQPLIVFVDDLDRCSAGTVAQVIEAVNLFLAGQFPNCIFVLGMEPAAVAAHVEAAYPGLAASTAARGGASLGWRFLDKIVQLPVSLPPPDRERDLPPFLDTLLTRPAASAPPATPAPVTPAPVIPAAPDPAPAAAGDDPALVDQLVSAIRQQRPTSLRLREATLAAQAELLGPGRSAGRPGGLHPAAEAAADRVFAELYSDADAGSTIRQLLPALDSVNPRELKRYVNLFRFYTFIVQKRRLQGQPAPSGEQLAKLAVLTIRWPHLVGLLSHTVDGVPLLHRLERAARPASGGNRAQDLADDQHLADQHLADQHLADLDLEPDDPVRVRLEAFLATGPMIGPEAARLL